MKERGYGDNTASSIKIPYGVSVTLYDESDFEGDSMTITGGMFEDDKLTSSCISLYSGKNKFDAKVSSMKVWRSSSTG